MRIQNVDGSPVPADLVDRSHLIAFSNQYAGEQPHDVGKPQDGLLYFKR